MSSERWCECAEPDPVTWEWPVVTHRCLACGGRTLAQKRVPGEAFTLDTEGREHRRFAETGASSCLECGCIGCECDEPWDVGEANDGCRYGDQRPLDECETDQPIEGWE